MSLNENEELFKAKINDLMQKFIIKLVAIYEFQISNLLMSSIVRTLLKNDRNKIDPSIISDLDNIEKSHVIIKNSGKSYEEILDEKIYIDSYQNFEEFIFQIFTTIYSMFPKFLCKQNEKKINIDYDDIFEKLDMADLKEKVIESKVKDIIQANNIIEIIKTFKKNFGINITLSNENLNNLFEISKKRNLIVHNNSRVNHIFIADLKKINRNNNYRINDDISKDIKNELVSMRALIIEVITKIADSLLSSVHQINEYHESI